ncbi:unnamed protein product [Prunus brigantina]
MKATRVLVYGDSQLIINQLTGDYQCTSENLAMYYVTALNTADRFSRISFVHVPRTKNHEANEMAQVASGVSIPADNLDRVIRIEKRTLPALAERGMTTQMASNELYRKGSDGLLLLCPSAKEIEVIMAESHEGVCGAHQSGIKMRWLVRRHGYYWPSILKDCIEYAKACIKWDGPWISSVKSTQPRPTSTLGFWWRPITSLSGSRPSPIGLFPVHRWLSFLNITSSTDLASPRLLRPTTAQSSHQPKLGSILKEWGSS